MTDRLRLEVLRPDHADRVFADFGDERIYTFIPERPPVSVEALRDRYRRMAAGPPAGGDERWLNWLLFRIDRDEPIGWLQATVYPGERRADVAWVLFPTAWGQGFATEAGTWLLGHLREVHGVERVSAEIDTRNTRSLALVERLGFTRDRTVPTDAGEDHVYLRSLGS